MKADATYKQTRYHDNNTPMIFTALKRSCGKVMFLHLPGILFTGGRHAWQGGGYAWLGGMHAGEMATEAGGTHPT